MDEIFWKVNQQHKHRPDQNHIDYDPHNPENMFVLKEFFIALNMIANEKFSSKEKALQKVLNSCKAERIGLKVCLTL